MQLQLIIHCVLLICLEFSASVPHGINPEKNPGIYNIKPPNAAYRQARIPRSHQVWNQRPPYPLPTQNQGFPQINHNSNIPNDHKSFAPNVPQYTPQAQFPNGYPNQHRIPSNIARFPNVPYQVDKKNIKNIPIAHNKPIQKIPANILVAKHHPNLPSQFRQNIVSNPAALKQTVSRTAEGNLSTQNVSKIVDKRKNNHNQKIPKGPSSVSSKGSIIKPEDTVLFKEVAIKNEAFKSFVPLIPSRPLHTGTSNTKFNEHHVKIIPSIENTIPRVAPIPFEDRYFASASNPVETITRKLTPPRYDVKQFISNSNIRNVLATTKHKKRYLVILPNGTIEHFDKLETVVQRNPNYVLIQAGDIITNPKRKVEKVQAAAKPVHSKKLQNVSVHTPIANTVKKPTANQQSTLLTAKNNIKLLKQVSVPPKQFTATAEVKLPTTAKNSITIFSTPKAPTGHPSRNETVPTVAPSKIKAIFSNHSKNNNNPAEKINHKDPEKQIPDTILNSSVSKPVHEEIKLIGRAEKPIVTDNYEKQSPNNKLIIIYGANITNDQKTETPLATVAKPVERISVQEIPVKGTVVKATVQTPKNNTPPAQEAVAVAEAVTETKPVVKDSTPVSNEKKVLPIEKSNKIDVIPKPTGGKSALSPAALNAIAEVKLTPHKTAVEAKTTTNSTETSTPALKQHNITPTIPKETLEKVKKKPTTTVAESESNDNPPKTTTNLPSKTENKKEKNAPAIWFKTSDPGFWEQLRGENKDDVVLFFQIHNRPKVEYNTTRTIYPNGTIVEETMKCLWEIEGDPPIVTKTTQIINPADQKR